MRAGIIRGKQVMNPHPVPRSVVRRPIFNEHKTIKSGDMFSSTSLIFVTTKIDYDKKFLKKKLTVIFVLGRCIYHFYC